MKDYSGMGISHNICKLEIEHLRLRLARMEEALKFCEKNDKTFYDYTGKNSLTRNGESPESGTCFLTPREIAKQALEEDSHE